MSLFNPATTTVVNANAHQLFERTIQQLAGKPDRSILKALATPRKGEGVAFGVPSIDTGRAAYDNADLAAVQAGAANWSPLTNKYTRRAYEGEAALDKTHANWQKLTTPFNDVARYNTLAFPREVEWGHQIHEEQELAELKDPTSDLYRQAMMTVFEDQDALVFAGLFGATMDRRRFAGTGANAVAFPAGQKLKTESVGAKFGLPAISAIVERMDKNYIRGERIYIAINPTHKRHLMDASTIHNKDFVRSREYFETGDLPDIYGCHLIPHPQVPLDYVVAWVQSGISYVTFKPLTSSSGVLPHQRFSTQLYVREYADCIRTDDKRVIWMELDEPSEG